MQATPAVVGQAQAVQPGVLSSPVEAKPVELVFVDGGVKDADQLVAQILAQRNDARTLEVHYLDASQDGIAQISAVLQGRHDIAALHLISHGADGALQLGSTLLDAESLPTYAQQIARWSEALKDHADVLVYGCDVAKTAVGQSFVHDMALLTGADVAASVDDTGAASLHGNWDLEYRQGVVDTPVVMGESASAQAPAFA